MKMTILMQISFRGSAASKEEILKKVNAPRENVQLSYLKFIERHFFRFWKFLHFAEGDKEKSFAINLILLKRHFHGDTKKRTSSGFLGTVFFSSRIKSEAWNHYHDFFFATPEKEFSAAFHALIQFKLMCLFYA